MSFTIPDSATAWNPIQARIQTGDLQILTDAIDQIGVVSGCAVTPQGSPNMTVAVASGTIHTSGANVTVSAGNVTITANASGSPRLDLICVDGSGAKSAQAGTAAASPKYPAIPGGSVVLAAVLVPTGATSITADNIVDKRALVITTVSGGLQAANNLSDVASASVSRTNLALGTMATQAASGVTITGGTVTGITDLAVADGGTGASSAAAARSNLDAAQASHTHLTSDITSGTMATARLGGGTASSSTFLRGDQTWAVPAGGGSGTLDTEILVAIGDETTTITSTGNPKLTMRMPHGMTLSEVRGSLTTASSSGAVTFDVAVEGDSIFSTALTIDQDETTSTTAATAAVLGTTDLWDDAELTFSISGAGTGAKGPKVALIGERADIAPPSSGTVTFVAEEHTTYASRTDTTITKPAGTANGDYVLLGILIGETGTAPADPTPPAGFTLLTGFPTLASEGSSFSIEMRVYGKVASSEGASWTFTHTAHSSQGFALTYRGVSNSTPLDVTPTTNSGSGTTTTALGITPVTNNSMIVLVAHDWGDTTNNLTPPTGITPTFTERIDLLLSYVADGALATAGATGNKTMTNNTSGGGGWAASLIALRPA